MVCFSEILRNRAQEKDEDSLVIEYLRFPLAVAVLLIHNFGSPVQMETLHQNAISLSALFDFLRIAISHVACHFANPAFFLISGYLFWSKKTEWTLSIYKDKIKKRVRTIFFPYCLWIILYITPDILNELWRIILYDKSFYHLLFYIYAIGDIHIFWDSSTWGTNYTNWLGISLSSSGPILGPLWFLRDLMVAMAFSPIIHFTITKWGKWTILVLWIFYLSLIWFPIHGFSIECYFWFSLGSFYAIEKKSLVKSIISFKVPAAAVYAILFPILVWNNGRIGDGIHTNQLMQILYPIFVSAAVVILFCVFDKIAKSNLISFLPKLGAFSFFLFASHIQILHKVNHFFPYFPEPLKFISFPIITICLSLAIYLLLSKYIPSLSSHLTGNRR